MNTEMEYTYEITKQLIWKMNFTNCNFLQRSSFTGGLRGCPVRILDVLAHSANVS